MVEPPHPPPPPPHFEIRKEAGPLEIVGSKILEILVKERLINQSGTILLKKDTNDREGALGSFPKPKKESWARSKVKESEIEKELQDLLQNIDEEHISDEEWELPEKTLSFRNKRSRKTTASRSSTEKRMKKLSWS